MSRRPALILRLEAIAAAAVPTVFLIGHWDATLRWSRNQLPILRDSAVRNWRMRMLHSLLQPAERPGAVRQ